MFKYTLDNKRYHTFNYFLKNKFGHKVFKVPLNANFSCPHKLSGGCIFCKDESQSNIINKEDNILNQFKNAKNVMLRKWPNSKYIAYFQAGTNTYADINILRNTFDGILNIDNVVGIAIATRPDCLSDECIKYLSELNKKTFLTIELGLQSSNDSTLKYINRGHDVACFDDAVNRLKKENIFVVAHIINGLPYETEKDMINTVVHLNKLKINGIKIHALYISKNTKLAKLYEKEKFNILSKDEYIDIVCKQLELLDDKIVIERITGDPNVEDLIVPNWLVKKFCLLNDIDKMLVKKDSYQGIKANKNC